MTTYLLAGGGTAGHVNPLLATADALRRRDPDARLLVLGTAEGLEARLVPERGYELITVPRLPFPRSLNRAALRFPTALRRAIGEVRSMMRARGVDVVVGFGGYASAPAYLAARRERVPIVIHEANARPGLANRLGARFTPYVAVTFPGTPLAGAQVTGMPLRHEIERLDRARARECAVAEFSLEPGRPTLLVTGGSLGAKRLNEALTASAPQIVASGWQAIHVGGARNDVRDPGVAGYHFMGYCDRMDLALAAADLAVSRSGASTVAELSALGVPALYVPYPHGNGEQALNARGAVEAGAASLYRDDQIGPDWVSRELMPLLRDEHRLGVMREAAAREAIRDGSDRLAALVERAATERRLGGGDGRGTREHMPMRERGQA